MKRFMLATVAMLSILALVACSGGGASYTPPDLAKLHSAVTIENRPLDNGGSARGQFPPSGSFLGFLFQGKSGETLDITLSRLTGHDVPAAVLYQFNNGNWSEPLAWASADAQQISIGGWKVPMAGSYLILVDVVSGDHSGTFQISLRCSGGCQDPNVCTSDADCPAGEVCWNGECFAQNIQCRVDSDCAAGEICENGLCTNVCMCASDADCPAGDTCTNCECQPGQTGCSTDADCPAGEYCQVYCGNGWCDGQCVRQNTCASNVDCPAGEICINGLCQSSDPCANVTCGAGQACCAGACVDTLFDPANCGACGAACAQGETCLRGVCMASQPCTTDADCPMGNVCQNGQCVPGDTGCKTDSDCPAGQICQIYCGNGWCNGTCIIPPACATDSDCPAGQVCINGLCQSSDPCANVTCGAGQACCAGTCVDILFDPANCGACGMACAQGETCLRGVCMASQPCTTDADCPVGNVCQNGQCVPGDTGCKADTDCPAGQICQIYCGNGWCNGTCVSPPVCTSDRDCPAGEACVNGQCVQVCGCASDTDCPAGEACVACQCLPQDPCANVSCSAGLTCCSGACIDLSNDPANCGSCGTACAQGLSCDQGTCGGAQPCRANSDCPAGMVCMNEVCVLP